MCIQIYILISDCVLHCIGAKVNLQTLIPSLRLVLLVCKKSLKETMFLSLPRVATTVKRLFVSLLVDMQSHKPIYIHTNGFEQLNSWIARILSQSDFLIQPSWSKGKPINNAHNQQPKQQGFEMPFSSTILSSEDTTSVVPCATTKRFLRQNTLLKTIYKRRINFLFALL